MHYAYSIGRDGKELKTFKEMSAWYLDKIAELKAANPEFEELPFQLIERKSVINMLDGFIPNDEESKVFRAHLFRYLAEFLNMRMVVAEMAFDENYKRFDDSVKKYSENEYADFINWFLEQMYLTNDFNLRKLFITKQIARAETITIEWMNSVKDLNTNLNLKSHFVAGQKFLKYLNEKLKQYEKLDSRYHYYSYSTGYFAKDATKRIVRVRNIESKYQLDFTNQNIAIGNKNIPYEPSDNEILNKFSGNFVRTFTDNPNEIENYLNFHYGKYQGEKRHWLRFTKLFLKDTLSGTPKFEDELKIVLDWISDKEQLLANEGQTKKQIWEQEKTNDFNRLIDPNFNYSPTLEDFIERITIEKLNLSPEKFLLKLREYKEVYANAANFYIQWGYNNIKQDSLNPHQNIYEEIKKMLKTELEKYESTTKQKDKPKDELKKPTSFQDIFSDKKWDKYVLALTNCDPPLLKHDKGKYKFIGNPKTQRGIVAQWFKYLRTKGVILQTVNRDDLARILKKEISNFSITGSSIDNQSQLYKKRFEKQLISQIS